MCGYNTKLANTTVVPSANEIEKGYDNTPSQQKPTTISNPVWQDTSASWKIKPNGEFDTSLTETSKSILQSAIRNSTKQKYKTYWNYWEKYCQCNQLNLPNISAANITNFLSSMFDKGASYSVIKAAKSALSHKYSIPPCMLLGDHPDIRKFMQGVFNLRPPKTKTGFVWDVKILFEHFKNMNENNIL